MPTIEQTPKLDFHNVLIQPMRSSLNSRNEVNLERTFNFSNGQKWTGIPIICANMATTGTFEVYEKLSEYKILTAFHKFYTANDYKIFNETSQFGLNPEYFMVSTGITDEDYNRLIEIFEVINIKWICIDIANGYIPKLIEFTNKIRYKFPNCIVVAGNVATPDMVTTLVFEGKVDIIKCGVGPGSACTTRKKTGVGMPQLSCIMDCANAAHGINAHIIGDGGITCPGDLCKAFCGGADFVMMGGVFAGHDENPGDIVTKEDGKKYKLFYGMSSQLAMDTHYEKKQTYRTSEGKEVLIPYKGSIHQTVNDYLGGLRSACTYISAKQIKHMSKCATFVIVSQQLNNIFN